MAGAESWVLEPDTRAHKSPPLPTCGVMSSEWLNLSVSVSSVSSSGEQPLLSGLLCREDG